MGKANQVLQHVLEKHDISQYSVAKTLSVERTNVYWWVHEIRDPTAETLLDIAKALKSLSHEATEEFVQLYLGEVLKSNE